MGADTMLTFSFLRALNFLSCSTVSGRWILYAYLSLSYTHIENIQRDMKHSGKQKCSFLRRLANWSSRGTDVKALWFQAEGSATESALELVA